MFRKSTSVVLNEDCIRLKRVATLDDIVTGVDGRPEVRSLLDNSDFAGGATWFLVPDAASQARRRILEERLRTMAGSRIL